MQRPKSLFESNGGRLLLHNTVASAVDTGDSCASRSKFSRHIPLPLRAMQTRHRTRVMQAPPECLQACTPTDSEWWWCYAEIRWWGRAITEPADVACTVSMPPNPSSRAASKPTRQPTRTHWRTRWSASHERTPVCALR